MTETETDESAAFEAERPRLLKIAARVLSDPTEAEDIVQQTWLRLHRSEAEVQSLPAWLTTVTTRLCLDRLRARVPVPEEQDPDARIAAADAPDPFDERELADDVGDALAVVLDRLSPRERIAFVLHDSFGYEFETVAEVLDTTPAAARKLASRARAKVGSSTATEEASVPADWQIVDAFMSAARGGDLNRLLELLASGASVRADAAAVQTGTPERIDGREQVAEFFNRSASAALPVFVGEQPGAAWFHRGQAMVLFDFTVVDGLVHQITFRAESDVLAGLTKRDGSRGREQPLPVTSSEPPPSTR